jgi:hypothetical protein
LGTHPCRVHGEGDINLGQLDKTIGDRLHGTGNTRTDVEYSALIKGVRLVQDRQISAHQVTDVPQVAFSGKIADPERQRTFALFGPRDLGRKGRRDEALILAWTEMIEHAQDDQSPGVAPEVTQSHLRGGLASRIRIFGFQRRLLVQRLSRHERTAIDLAATGKDKQGFRRRLSQSVDEMQNAHDIGLPHSSRRAKRALYARLGRQMDDVGRPEVAYNLTHLLGHGKIKLDRKNRRIERFSIRTASSENFRLGIRVAQGRCKRPTNKSGGPGEQNAPSGGHYRAR